MQVEKCDQLTKSLCVKFYSLKDTGITRLLHHVNGISVRDQARHSDISITNIYAQRENQADENLRDWNDVL